MAENARPKRCTSQGMLANCPRELTAATGVLAAGATLLLLRSALIVFSIVVEID